MLVKQNILGIEMEAAALYGIAPQHGVKALCMCTITDEIHLKNYDFKHEKFADPSDIGEFVGMTSDERETKMGNMALLALKTAESIIKNQAKK